MATVALKLVRDQIKAKLEEKRLLDAERKRYQNEVDEIITGAEQERRDLSDDEFQKSAELRSQLDQLDAAREELEETLAGLEGREQLIEANEKARVAAEESASRWGVKDTGNGNGKESVDRVAKVTKEERVYSRASELRGVSFYGDLYRSLLYQDPGARERLHRHQQEARIEELAGYEGRDVGTGAFTGLVVPQYLTGMAAPLARAMRPTVDICNRHPLPADGMTVNISRITTGTAVAVQASENTAATETNADDTLLTVNVRTYAGMQDVSRQALERGTGVDDIITQDLLRAHWTSLDGGILNDDGTGGTHLGIRSTASIVSVSYADTTPTIDELYPQLANLISQIQAGVFMGVTHFVMHPRRWWWLVSRVGTNFPFLHIQDVPTVQAGQVGGTEYGAAGRQILGVPVVVDGNIPTNISTNQDVILGVTAPELHLWIDDGAPVFIRAEQSVVDQLTVRFVCYSYSAFTAGRYPGAHGTVGGTGLITPTF